MTTNPEPRFPGNSSGQGPLAAVPPEIDRWNWGAFLLSWIWGIGNNTWIALLALVPFVNLVMPFVLGARGSRWAWRNRRWESVAHFRIVQRRWAIAGLLVTLLGGALLVASVYATRAALKQTPPFAMAMASVTAAQAVTDRLGVPVVAGLPDGRISETGQVGSATFTIPVSGPKGSGTVYVYAAKAMGRWRLGRVVLEDAGTGERVDLIAPPPRRPRRDDRDEPAGSDGLPPGEPATEPVSIAT